jgi:archaellum biogenesis ATPase FlaH
MSTERKLLAAAVNDRRAFDLLAKHLGPSDLSEPGKRVFHTVQQYYARDPKAASCDLETVTSLVLQSATNPKHKEAFQSIMDALGRTDVSGINVAQEIIGAKMEAVGARLSTALAAGELPEVTGPLLEEYQSLARATSLDDEEESDLMVAPSLRDLLPDGKEELIRLLPKTLNARLDGGLERQRHVVIIARPEMGKTAFLVNLGFGFLKQGLRVLYLGNEEPIEDTAMRFICRLSSLSRKDVLNHPDKAYDKAMQAGYEHLYLKGMHPGSLPESEALCAEVKPDGLIIDQLRHIRTSDDNRTQQLERAANGVRQIGRRHDCLVISTTQAGDSAQGKGVLDMGDVDSSNTGIPGACDVLIGIGASRDDEASGRRVLSLCKNKRSGNHEFFPVRIVPELSKYMSMEE